MMMDELAATYRGMSDGELLAVARGYDGLVDAAQGALRAEFARRGLEAPLAEEEASFRKLVTVRRYRDLSEAIVVRSMFEAAGVPVYLFDENLVRLDWQISNFVGGIRLQVKAADEAVALELLDQPVPEEIDFAVGEEFEQPHCPVCGSLEITFEGASRAAAVISLWLVSVPLPSGRKTWRCENCGARWVDEADGAVVSDKSV